MSDIATKSAAKGKVIIINCDLEHADPKYTVTSDAYQKPLSNSGCLSITLIATTQSTVLVSWH